MSTGRREAPARKVPRQNFPLKLGGPNPCITNKGRRWASALARRLEQAKNKKTSEKGDFMFPNSAVTKVNDSNPRYGCYAVLKRVPSGDYRLQIATEAFSDQLYRQAGQNL